MKKHLFFALFFALFVAHGAAQISFSLRNDLIGDQSFHSGVAIGVVDMNGDGRDDLVHLDEGMNLKIEFQTVPGEPFLPMVVGEMSNESVWSMCVGDVDNNGFPDVMSGGSYDGVHLARADANGLIYTLSTTEKDSLFVQGSNFFDLNNDGLLDYFACHDDGPARIWMNNGQGQLILTAVNAVIKTAVVGGETDMDSNDSGNYGSLFTDVDNDGDFDLYIAKCRQGVNDPNDPRRINLLFIQNADGSWTEDAAARGLAIGAQSWTADFGDIDNDGDMDCFITNHDVPSILLENDGTGHFTDISAGSGVESVVDFPIQGIFRDFDNDGFLDIVVAGGAHLLLRNNGDKTFSELPDAFDDDVMESFAIGDFNSDGFPDIYGGYAMIYQQPSNIDDKIWLNDGNANHFFGLTLRGQVSNRDGIGSRISLHTPLGLQIRDVRSGESYGIMNSLNGVFGMGANEVIDSVVVTWQSGIRDVLKNPAADQYLTLFEGGCSIPPVTISALGPLVFCTGQSVEIAAPAGFSYKWNTGDTTQTITVSQAGIFKVLVTSPDGCKTVSNILKVETDPIEVPTIAAIGDTLFCRGGSVELKASAAQAWEWSNSAGSTQTVTITESGSYAVTTQGLCQFWTSGPVTVQVLDSPLPVVENDVIAIGEMATLTATGTEPHWFDSPTGGLELAIGSPFLTAPLTDTTSFWVENHEHFGGDSYTTGQLNHAGGQFGSATFNGEIIFDALVPFILDKVKVYNTTAGIRSIVVLNSAGDVLARKTLNIATGTNNLTLELDIPAGQGLRLTTDADTNMLYLNSEGPKLRRSDNMVEYPYLVPGILSINESNFGTDRYYYFYAWQIRTKDIVCISDRVEVKGLTDPNIISTTDLDSKFGFDIFPNPTDGAFSMQFELPVSSAILVEISDVNGRLVQTEKGKLSAGNSLISSELGAIPPGVYSAKCTVGGVQKTVRLTVF